MLDFDDLVKKYKALPSYVVEIGVVGDDSERTGPGISNAELMYIHEYGSPVNHLPKRPVLHLTIDHAKKYLIPDIVDHMMYRFWLGGGTEKAAEHELNVLCNQMQNYAQNLIYNNDGRLVPNSPGVAKSKWKKANPGLKRKAVKHRWHYPAGSHPLFNTGQLARSITAKWSKY